MIKGKAKICVPVCVARASDLPAAVERAAKAADIVEVRLDCLDKAELAIALENDSQLRGQPSRPLIWTFRPAEQGGRREIDRDERQALWSSLIERSGNDFFDVEFELLSTVVSDGQQIICSHHDFEPAPPNLDQLYAKMAATNARVLKIAIQAGDAIDCLPVFHLLERAVADNRDTIAIAMGQAGLATRILGPSRGAFLTYGSLDGESATAPGQLTARELREVYRIDRIDRGTAITGLMGKPVGHSISPMIQNRAFEFADVNAVYLPFEVDDVDSFMRRMAHPRSREIDWKLRGLSVTAPHKVAVMDHLDWIDPVAKEIGAVNTIVVTDDELHGYNTDAAAFIRPLTAAMGALKRTRVAVIGAGGAARSALWALKREGVSVSLFVRNPETGRQLSGFGVDINQLEHATFKSFDVVINATPVGTRGHSEAESLVSADQLRGVRLVYDLVYNPIETRLMQIASATGCRVLGGLEMLIAQAAEQFKLWMGIAPDQTAMRTAASDALREPASSEL